MSDRREPLELPDTGPESLDRLLAVARQDWQDMGAVRARFRVWPGNVFWVVAAVIVLVAPLAALLAPDADARVWIAVLIAAVFAFFLALVVLVGVIERNQVCEHGLVVGLRTKSRYVVPWSTVDPGRVRVVRRSNLLGRIPGRPPSSPHYRVGMAAGTAVAINGLDTAQTGWVRVPGLLEVTEASTAGGRGRVTPFVWWFLGTRRPERLLRAIEDAMVADGYPAHGLADRALAQACTLRLNPGDWNPFPPRMGTDPVLGVDGPRLP